VLIFFFINLLFLPPPYFDHDAFMHDALHILDAPGRHDMTQRPKEHI